MRELRARPHLGVRVLGRLDPAHVGVQYIRAASILQLLLGNIGRPGGGILALRGHASIQGSTDIPTLFDLLPGYLPMPSAGHHDTLDDYERRTTAAKGYWSKGRTFIVSLLRGLVRRPRPRA